MQEMQLISQASHQKKIIELFRICLEEVIWKFPKISFNRRKVNELIQHIGLTDLAEQFITKGYSTDTL